LHHCATPLPPTRAFLAALPIEMRVALEGTGELVFSGEARLWPVANTLATPGLPVLATLKLPGASAVAVSVRWRLTGDFELSATRTDSRLVRLDFHRRAGSAFSVSASASIGETATPGRRDLFEWLTRALGADSEGSVLPPDAAGLTSEQFTGLLRAVAASVDRTLSLAAHLHIAASCADEALASFEIDLDRLDQAAEAALDETVRGWPAALGLAASTRGEHGVRLVSSTATRLLRRRTRWQVNLLGALNAPGLSELVRRGTCTYDPIGGALTIADEVASTGLSVSTRPLETDPARLRRVLLESLIVTAAYRGSGTLRSVHARLRHAFVEQRTRASVADLRRCYAAIGALGLCDATEIQRRLASATGVDRLTWVLECRLARQRPETLFLAAGGMPHGIDHYERLARTALLALLPQDDEARAFRRWPLAHDEVWARLKALGQPNLAAALPPAVARDPWRVAMVAADYRTITWWATAMHRAARALAQARAWLGAHEGSLSPSDSGLAEVRRQLERALAPVVSTAAEPWGDPWDILALHLASGGRAAMHAAIVSPALTASYRGARLRRPAPGPRSAPDEFTPADRDLLARHVVNLRDGMLAGAAPGAASEDAVRRIFTRLGLEDGGQRRGTPTRIVFLAQGGLAPETVGLRAALARIPFWRASGLYPVFFVWHAGLAETLGGLVRSVASAVDPQGPPRGPILDAIIEAAVRVPAQSIWSQMKRSAERAAVPGGGARLVAQLARELAARAEAVEIHAVGHSAGSIFLAHFLPALLEGPPGGNSPHVETLHLIAPAITTALFASRVKHLVGPDAPIRRFTLYALRAECEINDCLGPYGKSLLHLVRRSCEPECPTPLLGLQESVERDVRLARFFGFAGTSRVADVLFAPTAPDARPRDRAEAASHAGFGDDPATMDTIVHRMGSPEEAARQLPWKSSGRWSP
jgi:hypothetical protein